MQGRQQNKFEQFVNLAKDQILEHKVLSICGADSNQIGVIVSRLEDMGIQVDERRCYDTLRNLSWELKLVSYSPEKAKEGHYG